MLQQTIHCIPATTNNTLHSCYNKQYTAFVLQQTIHCIRATTNNILHSCYNKQYTAFVLQQTIHCIRATTNNTLHSFYNQQQTSNSQWQDFCQPCNSRKQLPPSTAIYRERQTDRPRYKWHNNKNWSYRNRLWECGLQVGRGKWLDLLSMLMNSTRFEVLNVVWLKTQLFWVVMLRHCTSGSWHFEMWHCVIVQMVPDI